VRYGARSRWLAGYALFNLVLFIVPLVSLVLGTMYLYDARELTESLLAQPAARREMYAGLYLGLALPLALAFLGGVGPPLLPRFDVGALLGYTGAVLERFFGSAAGILVALAALSAWLVLPLALGARGFGKRGFRGRRALPLRAPLPHRAEAAPRL
jgi:hypothetical protein